MKFMNMKRFGAVTMAGALALSLTAPAFAADKSTEITGSYAEIPISVSVPTTGTAQINPFGLPVRIPTGEEATTPVNGQQITTQPLNIKNMGDVALDVNATLLVIPKGDVAIAAAKGANETNTAKDIKVTLEVVGLDDAEYGVSSENEGLEYKLNAKFADPATWTGAKTLAAPAVAKGATSGTAAKSASAMATLGAATVGDGSVTYGNDSIALFRLTGEMNEEPKTDATTDAPWATTDGFKATVVFKFKPHQAVAASVSLDNSTLTVASGTPGTLTATYNAGDSGLSVTKYDWASDDTTKATVVTGGTSSATSTTVTHVATGSANVTVTVTLSDGSTVTATCAVTCS